MKILLFVIIALYRCNNLILAEIETTPTTPAFYTNSDSLVPNDEESPTNSEDPVSSINIDYLNNGLVFQFRRSIKSDNTEIETRRRSALDKNFMRFGRTDKSDKNLMRFGRSSPGFIRFGRSPPSKNLMRFGRDDKNLMRFGRTDGKNLMRFGRTDKNLMRFGRLDKNFIRFGRTDKSFKELLDGNKHITTDSLMEVHNLPAISVTYDDNEDSKEKLEKRPNLMRFGRGESEYERYGKLDRNFMRLGKSDKNLMRFGRTDKNLMRFGRPDPALLVHPGPDETDNDKLHEDHYELPLDFLVKNMKQQSYTGLQDDDVTDDLSTGLEDSNEEITKPENEYFVLPDNIVERL